MRFRTLWMVGVVTIAPSLALGQEPPENQGRPNRPGAAQRLGGPLRGEGRGEGPGAEMMARGLAMMSKNFPVMKALDLDEDGRLSSSEIESAPKSLMKLDKNGDGVLSEDELRPEPGPWMNLAGPGGPRGPGGPGAGMPGGGPAMLLRLFENRDKDGDGKLSGDEIPEQMRERIGMLDENGDGAIEKSEVEKMRARIEAGGGKRPDRRESGGEGVRPNRPPRSEDKNKKDDKQDDQ